MMICRLSSIIYLLSFFRRYTIFILLPSVSIVGTIIILLCTYLLLKQFRNNIFCIQAIVRVQASQCGCNQLQQCYKQMLAELKEEEEAACIEDASIGSSATTTYLKALEKYCADVVSVTSEHVTFDGRNLYEVIIEPRIPENNVPNRPTIVIDAGQEAGTEPVRLALYVIEQLTACQEYQELTKKVRWVIMPSVNPDGQEYSRYSPQSTLWRKNCRLSEDKMSIGVDITRNFDTQWGSCAKIDSGFSPMFPGPSAGSENETVFIKSVIAKHREYTKLYLSIKRNGHSIAYPHAFTKNGAMNTEWLRKVAGDVATRVNQRTSGVHLFTNDSIYNIEGHPHCGHSVDYAYEQGITNSFEMRVFLESDNSIMSMFQNLPRGYETSLRNGYFGGIKELYNMVISDKEPKSKLKAKKKFKRV